MTAAEEKAYRAVNMTADEPVQFQVCLSGAEIQATTWSITDMDRIVNQLHRAIYGIPSKDQMRHTKGFSLCVVVIKDWCQAIGNLELWKTIEQHVIKFRYSTMHHLRQISESIGRIGSGENFTTDRTELLHIDQVKEPYRSTNQVNYIQQMLKHNHWCTRVEYMKEPLRYFDLQGWYDIDSAKVIQSALSSQ